MENSNGRSPPHLAQKPLTAKLIALENIEIAVTLYSFILKILNQKVMKTTVIENGKSNGQLSNGAANAASGSVAFAGNGAAKAVEEKKEDKVIGAAEPKKEEVKVAETSQATKSEIKKELTEQKPAMNLEQVLKLVESLHRKKIQRDKLVETITTLEEFEVRQLDEAEETGLNHYQRCELVIEDDKGNEFKTKNPFIIKEVAERVKALCVGKLSEIEGEMVVPA